ncbi:hypothetical protein BH09PSE6_BH09PSE6_02480 [soil metagenome]
MAQMTNWWSDLMDMLFFRYDFVAELAEGDAIEH